MPSPARGELSEAGAAFPKLVDASEVWGAVSLPFLDGKVSTELAYTRSGMKSTPLAPVFRTASSSSFVAVV
jgi:hypothetical protein